MAGIQYNGYRAYCWGCGRPDRMEVMWEDRNGLMCRCFECGSVFQIDGEGEPEYYPMNDYCPPCPKCGWHDSERLGYAMFRCTGCGNQWTSEEDEEWWSENDGPMGSCRGDGPCTGCGGCTD